MSMSPPQQKSIQLSISLIDFNPEECDEDDEQDVQKLIHFVQELQVKKESFNIVKKLIINYGLALMIFLQPFYAKINQTNTEPYLQILRNISVIGRQMMGNNTIKRLSFMFVYGESGQESKKIQKSEKQEHFIKLITELDSLNNSILEGNSKSISFQQYNEFVSNQINNPKYTKLMIKAIEKFKLNHFDMESLSSMGKECLSFSVSEKYAPKEEPSLSDKGISDSNSSTKSYYNYLCCQRYFIEDEEIRTSEGTRTAFLNGGSPFSNARTVEIKKIICSFLNSEGGILYIGIQKRENGKRYVQLNLYTENQKQQIIKSIRKIAESFEPNIIIQKIYEVNFVPIKFKINQQYIPGACVIKIAVNYGIRDQFYSFVESGKDYFIFRYDHEMIEKTGRELLKAHKGIIKNPLPIPEPLHDGPCQKPNIGELLHSMQQKKLLQNQLKKNSINRNSNINRLNLSKTSTKPSQNSKISQNEIQSYPPLSFTKKGIESQMESHQYPTTTKQSQEDSAFFFVVGIDEKHLAPIFVTKNIQNNAQIQPIKSQKLVAKVFGKNEIEIARKIFQKLQAKYKQKGVAIVEIKLQLQIYDKFQQALQLLKTINSKYKIITKNQIRYPNLIQSLKAYILLQSQKFKVKFKT